MVFNFSYGMANKDFKHLAQNITYKHQVEQM